MATKQSEPRGREGAANPRVNRSSKQSRKLPPRDVATGQNQGILAGELSQCGESERPGPCSQGQGKGLAQPVQCCLRPYPDEDREEEVGAELLHSLGCHLAVVAVVCLLLDGLLPQPDWAPRAWEGKPLCLGTLVLQTPMPTPELPDLLKGWDAGQEHTTARSETEQPSSCLVLGLPTQGGDAHLVSPTVGRKIPLRHESF